MAVIGEYVGYVSQGPEPEEALDGEPAGAIEMESWILIMGRHPELAPMPPSRDIRGIEISRPYAATVVLAAQSVGTMTWEGDVIHVYSIREALGSVEGLARQIAKELDATFTLDPRIG